jgi:hypothetical protein
MPTDGGAGLIGAGIGGGVGATLGGGVGEGVGATLGGGVGRGVVKGNSSDHLLDFCEAFTFHQNDSRPSRSN